MPTPHLDSATLADAKVLWDYHRLGATSGRADVILGLGSYDLSVAEHAAQLFLEARGSWLFFAGGLVPRTDLLRTPWDRAEAVWRARARDRRARGPPGSGDGFDEYRREFPVRAEGHARARN